MANKWADHEGMGHEGLKDECRECLEADSDNLWPPERDEFWHEADRKLKAESARWNGFSKAELYVIWYALYADRARSETEGWTAAAELANGLMMEMYHAKNWLGDS